jgi:hypothetical protein
MLLKARVVVLALRVEQAEVVLVGRQALLEASAPADQHKEHHKEDYQLERFVFVSIVTGAIINVLYHSDCFGSITKIRRWKTMKDLTNTLNLPQKLREEFENLPIRSSSLTRKAYFQNKNNDCY